MTMVPDEYWAVVARTCAPLTRTAEEHLDKRLLAARERLAAHPGDCAAERELGELRGQYVLGSVRYAIKYACQFSVKFPVEDACQEAITGLLRAFEKYDPTRGVRFLSYAKWWMRAALEPAVAQSRTILTIPRDAGQAARDVAKGGARASWEEAVTRALSARVSDLDVLVGRDAVRSDANPEEDASTRLLLDRLRSALRTLDPRTREVLSRHWGLGDGDGETFRSIGRDLGISRELARRIARSGEQQLYELLGS